MPENDRVWLENDDFSMKKKEKIISTEKHAQKHLIHAPLDSPYFSALVQKNSGKFDRCVSREKIWEDKFQCILAMHAGASACSDLGKKSGNNSILKLLLGVAELFLACTLESDPETPTNFYGSYPFP